MTTWNTYHTTKIHEKYLYQFFSDEKFFLDVLTTGNIFFKTAFKFGDHFECVNVKELVNPMFNKKQIFFRQKRHAISCWHLANRESVSMWETYNKSRFVALRFKYSYLKNLVKKQKDQCDIHSKGAQFLIAGKIQYRDLVSNSPDAMKRKNLKIKYVAFRKDVSFSYENEFRFVISSGLEFKGGFSFNLGNPSALAFDIILNPFMSKQTAKKYVDEINKKGFGDRIKKSSLSILFKLFNKK